SGVNGYECYRIPAIIEVKRGLLIAFAEGRRSSCSDFGDVDIIYKKSTDDGKIWSEMKSVVDYGNLQAGNPAPVLDLQDPRFPNGRLFLFYNTGTASEHDVVNGKGVREVLFITSIDFGETWSSPTNITTQVHRPNEPNVNPAYNFKEDWRHFANTPGHAIQLKNGRLFVPINYSQGDVQKGKINYHANAFYSDDHGETFQISESLDLQGSNEATAAQLSNGEVLFNARDQTEKTGKRYYARSKDNGETWYEQGIDEQLTDPVCEGSLNIIRKRKGDIVLLSHLNHERERKNLELKSSYDGGETWAKSQTIDLGSAAYSDLVVLSKKRVGVLYEKDDYQRIVFKVLAVE
ncbi:MAG: sialidase-1, partial [Spirosomataceae bacterium]